MKGEFRLSLIPLGGYCRFYGEESLKKAIENKLNTMELKKDDFYNETPLKRIIVVLSGPLSNFIFSVLVFTFIFLIGYNESYYEPKIILVSDYSNEIWPADIAGLKTGDYIIAIDDKPYISFLK